MSNAKRWTGLIFKFLAGQGSAQLINLITGFLLLRWLSVEAYAQYSVAFGFQSTLGMLVDLGFSGAIIALVGDRCNDPAIVGSYIRSGQHFRNLLFAILIPLAAIAFPLITAKHGWHWTAQILLFIPVVIYLFFEGWVAYYSAPLLLHRQLKPYYQTQIASATSRLGFSYLLYLANSLSAWMAAAISAMAVAINGWCYRRYAAPFIAEPRHSNPKINREMLTYLLPLMPGIIFTAFQSQISLFLIAIFGQTNSIAEVAALGRLGQLFLLLAAFNGTIIYPYMAKLDKQNLKQRYGQILAAAIAIAAIICTLAFIFPAPLLWILGHKYENLRLETGWMVAVSCLQYISGVLWTMHSARKWVYWWHTGLHISLVLIAQSICIATMPLNTSLNAIYFSAIAAAVGVFSHAIAGIYGFIYGCRRSLIIGKV